MGNTDNLNFSLLLIVPQPLPTFSISLLSLALSMTYQDAPQPLKEAYKFQNRNAFLIESVSCTR